MAYKCVHCEKEILEYVEGRCPICGVYRVILPEPVEEKPAKASAKEKSGE